jgi:4-hydroxy-tetrahydrodipicolinate reductase
MPALTPTIRLAVVGAHGRMGATIVQLAEADERFTVSARVVAPNEPLDLLDATLIADLDPATVDVLIDFTHRDAVALHGEWCGRHGIGWVLGTTGLTDADQQAVGQAGLATAVFHASNFSLGVALLADLSARAAKVLGTAADVEIVETHHGRKKDAPSGTALTLAQAVAGARGQVLDDVRRDGRSGMVGERPVGEIGIHAVRLSDVVGEHDVQFGWPDERLLLRHEAKDRRVFAAGALRAAVWLQEVRAAGRKGRFGMADLLAT